jgi:hypothetical protein
VRPRELGLFLVAAMALAFWIQRGALGGTPISDDLFLLYDPHVQEFSLANWWAIWDPRGPVAASYRNYSPVHALLHAGAIRAFGDWLPGHHALNVTLHALSTLLLLQLLLESGVARGAALAGAALFLVHPANVEPVAWMSQLKTTAATALAMAALLAARRRPALALGLFGLALLTKAVAAFAWPVLLAREWCDREPRAPRSRWAWAAAWGLAFALYAPLQIAVFAETASVEKPELGADRWLHARTVLAVAARYGFMAATGGGLSTEHEPSLARSAADPWVWAGLAGLLAILARTLVTLRRRQPESAWWIWALAAVAPVSQVAPFIHPIADRYLYPVLPGLIGALLLAGGALWRARVPDAARPLAVAVVVTGIVLFTARSAERALVFRHMDAYLVDAALHYPDGVNAHVLRARGLARSGDVAAAMAALRAARAQGWSWVGVVFVEPDFASLRADPRFRAFARELGVATRPPDVN